MDLYKTPDTINTLIKTINPVHEALSKQNKELNGYFLSFNLDVANFMKTLNKIYKRQKAPSLYDTLYKKSDTKYIYDKDIQKTFNKLRNMQENKYIPKELIDKFKFKFDKDIKEKNKEKKIFRKNKIDEMKNKIKIADDFLNEITLAPGRYNPKYNLIYKKTPDIYFQKNKNIILNDLISAKNDDKKYRRENGKLNNLKKKFNKINQKDNNNNKNRKNFLILNDIDKLYNFKKKDKRIISSNFMNNINNKNKKNFSTSMTNLKTNKLIQPNMKLLNKTHSSNSFHKINLKKNYKNSSLYLLNNDLNYISNKFNNAFISKKIVIKRSKSYNNYNNSNKKILSFNKMKGRKLDLFGTKEINRSDLVTPKRPKRELFSPREIRLNLTKKKFQNFKKYAVNKIIRNYNYYSPRDYFIFDINEKNKKSDKKYINNIYTKYHI